MVGAVGRQKERHRDIYGRCAVSGLGYGCTDEVRRGGRSYSRNSRVVILGVCFGVVAVAVVCPGSRAGSPVVKVVIVQPFFDISFDLFSI